MRLDDRPNAPQIAALTDKYTEIILGLAVADPKFFESTEQQKHYIREQLADFATGLLGKPILGPSENID